MACVYSSYEKGQVMQHAEDYEVPETLLQALQEDDSCPSVGCSRGRRHRHGCYLHPRKIVKKDYLC